ncbi:MAG: winged helix-turn-helix transcriptional regulator, partial [Rhodobacter sp.]|nr:winged helix-turn-helix transcriptional regulator [Rhodobacter sp.]
MTKLTETFAALGDKTRFAIVERLLTEGELSAGELQAVADISAPAISRHLKVLRLAG